MAEGGTYVCHWRKERRGYTLWLDENDALHVTDPDFGAAAEDLAWSVMDWNGDGEAVLEFDPPRPIAGEDGLAGRLVNIGYNASARVINRSEALFTGGLCDRCQFGIGQRTKEPLELDDVQKGDVLGLERLLPYGLILSEAFIDLLSDVERESVSLQPVIAPARFNLFELVGPSLAKPVGVPGAEYPSVFHQSFVCGRCDRRAFSTNSKRFADTETFIPRTALPARIPSVFAFDDGFRMCLVATQARWRELLKNKVGTRGAATQSIGLLPDELVDAEPELSEPAEFDWVL